MQRPASCRWQKVVLRGGLYTQCAAVSTLDGSIKVPVHNTRRLVEAAGSLPTARHGALSGSSRLRGS